MQALRSGSHAPGFDHDTQQFERPDIEMRHNQSVMDTSLFSV
jgi:hypothetical protein